MNKSQFVECLKAIRSISRTGNPDLDFVSCAEDGETITGPDGKRGWFNCGSSDNAFRNIDPTVVREFQEIYFMLQAITAGDVGGIDQTLLENTFKFSE